MRPARLGAAAVTLAAVVPYLSTIRDYFMRDDFGVVWLLSQKAALHFPRWFVGPWTEDIWGYVPDEVRPFPALSYQIAAAFGAGSPAPNHIMNIGFHAANASLVMWLGRLAAGMSWPGATLAGLVFAVLPMQAESVVWVTGRVDSLPTFFYLASFGLFIRWRQQGLLSTYVGSILLFFAALFSKQNTITLPVALVLYDWLVGRVPLQLTWRWMRPYVPYGLLTLGFLWLRYVLFHEVAREGLLNAQRWRGFTSDVSQHLMRMIAGDAYLRTSGVIVSLVVAGVALALWAWARRGRTSTNVSVVRSGIFFGVCWIALGVAPTLMAGYYSPRHMYLASAGWAIFVGMCVDAVWLTRGIRGAKVAAAAAGAALVAFYAVQLLDVLGDWHARAAMSYQATVDLEREADAAPEGTLIIVGAPAPSWSFSVPYASRPPFTRTDLSRRVLLVSDSTLYCCPAQVWEEYTRRTLRSWQTHAGRPPVMALYWNARTHNMSKLTDEQEPFLRTVVSLMLATRDRAALDSSIRTLLNDHVALIAPTRRGDTTR